MNTGTYYNYLLTLEKEELIKILADVTRANENVRAYMETKCIKLAECNKKSPLI